MANWRVVRISHGDPDAIAAELAEAEEFVLSPQANGDVILVLANPETPAPSPQAPEPTPAPPVV